MIALFSRRGLSASDAEDLAQEFFLVALKRNFLEKANPKRGRFRGYLRTAAMRHVISHQRKASRRDQIDKDSARLERAREVAPGPSPEEAFDQAWARSLLERAKMKTFRGLLTKGKAHYFEAFAMRAKGGEWKEIAQRCETTPAAVQGWVRYVKQTYTGNLRFEIAGTVTGPGAIDSELKELESLLQLDSDPTL